MSSKMARKCLDNCKPRWAISLWKIYLLVALLQCCKSQDTDKQMKRLEKIQDLEVKLENDLASLLRKKQSKSVMALENKVISNLNIMDELDAGMKSQEIGIDQQMREIETADKADTAPVYYNHAYKTPTDSEPNEYDNEDDDGYDDDYEERTREKRHVTDPLPPIKDLPIDSKHTEGEIFNNWLQTRQSRTHPERPVNVDVYRFKLTEYPPGTDRKTSKLQEINMKESIKGSERLSDTVQTTNIEKPKSLPESSSVSQQHSGSVRKLEEELLERVSKANSEGISPPNATLLRHLVDKLKKREEERVKNILGNSVGLISGKEVEKRMVLELLMKQLKANLDRHFKDMHRTRRIRKN